MKIRKLLILFASLLVCLALGLSFLNVRFPTHPKFPVIFQSQPSTAAPDHGPDFAILWMTDFQGNRVIGFTPQGKVVWAQNMSAPPIPRSSWYFIGGVERVTVAPNGNLITSYGDAMIVQEIDRATHNLVWQYGTAGVQTYRGGKLDEPHRAFKLNDHEVLINDSNDREVIVVDQRTNQVVWQYGQYHQMGTTPGLLRGNTSACPVDGGKEFLITDTLEKKIMLVDRATKAIVWQWYKPDSLWLENAFVTPQGTFVMTDRQKGEVFEVNRQGQILWDLTRLSDADHISYPTDAVKLANGDVLIAEAGRARIVEVVPQTGVVVREYLIHGFVSTIAIDQNGLDGTPPPEDSAAATTPFTGQKQTIVVNDQTAGRSSASPTIIGKLETFLGKVQEVNASTGRAGQVALRLHGGTTAVEVYNYSRVTDRSGTILDLGTIQAGDNLKVVGTLSSAFIAATSVQDSSR